VAADASAAGLCSLPAADCLFRFHDPALRQFFSKPICMAQSVLIVEDNEHLRNILASFPQFSGYEVLEAASGAEAIEKAGSAQPKLILLDLSLPDMNGATVAQSIKKNQRSARIPIVACVQHRRRKARIA
jgi:CheY-like chemotaxis protein